MKNVPLLTVIIKYDQDAVLARQRTIQIGTILGLGQQDLTRVATAVSELARNVLRYTSGGKAEYFIAPGTPSQFMVRISDTGKGIKQLQEILDGVYVSPTGMGLGILGSKRLSDNFEIRTSEKGTVILLGKIIPEQSLSMPELRDLVTSKLVQTASTGVLEMFEKQNQELVVTLSEVLARQRDIERLNRELVETNRGVVALYAEVDEKNEALKRMSELKSRFLSAISHELRTPLSSIRSMSRLLLDRMDGELTPEQAKQVNYIRSTAEGLTEMVNDLLDLAKIEAGKIDVRTKSFEVEELFTGLRGMFRPMLDSRLVSLSFEIEPGMEPLNTDEGKVLQVLRNLISNSLKFTPEGQITVTAIRDDQCIRFEVKDTGIGISPEHHERIFEEYAQVDSPLQRSTKGTGLGLPLSRKLAVLLGGGLTVKSTPDVGSIFIFHVPRLFTTAESTDCKDVRRGSAQLETPHV